MIIIPANTTARECPATTGIYLDSRYVSAYHLRDLDLGRVSEQDGTYGPVATEVAAGLPDERRVVLR